MLAILPLTVLLGSFIARAAADTSFVTPGGSGSTGWKNNPSYEVDESMNVEWTTDLEETNLLLWQDYPAAGGGTQFFLQLRENTTSTSFIWQVSFNGFSTRVNKGEDAVFHFSLFKSGTNDIFANSAAFNVTVPQDEETSAASTVEPSPTPTNSATETTTKSSTETESTTEAAASNKDEGLSTGAVAGIAVGATLGGIAVLAGLGFLLWKHMRKGSGAAAGGYAPPSEMATGAQNQPVQEYYKAPEPHQQAPAEMAGQPWVHPPQAGYQGGLHEAP
ncbi:hypothetical protein FAVG1_00738 [Fusarium avenaceum]|nr:hypothetical protein FAVG1_00738 [Fusarium avenaceum]